MPDENQQEPQFVRVESRQGIFNLYANNFNATWTAHDVRVIFGELIRISTDPATNQRTFTIEDRSAVTMAWTEAKLLAAMLTDIVTQCETKNGEIKLPTIP
jgi:hypothetical protein